MTKIKAVFNWSGGKDSAHALWRALQSGRYEIVALLTTADRDTGRSTMHAIPEELLHAQAERIGIPLHIVRIPAEWGSDAYASAMRAAVEHFRAQGVTHFIFGDIHLHDVRRYREAQLTPYGLEVVEPLWDETSEQIIEGFLASGLRTVVVTTMADRLGAEAIGRELDAAFVASLPAGTDPNGENGEYHTFCYDGPIFRSPVPFRLGPRHPPRRRHRAHLHLLVRRTRSGRITLRSAAVASSRRGDGMFPCTLPGFTVPPGCPVPAAPHKYEPRRSRRQGIGAVFIWDVWDQRPYRASDSVCTKATEPDQFAVTASA